ncbi:MAG TPA: GNAT family N-acetyltransferase [Pyrinomonadaceae bacterium]|nr:GNAT family N-acetyltransferase [Pyrinomonadaceae bacterium]
MIEFRSLDSGDLEAVQAFLAENGWEKRVADSERFQRMIENANRTVVAVDGDRIVGFARALCDGASNGYIGTVAVAEDKRIQGIGREMVRRLIGDDPNITWVLRAGRGSEEFWQRMGFEHSTVAMERSRI